MKITVLRIEERGERRENAVCRFFLLRSKKSEIIKAKGLRFSNPESNEGSFQTSFSLLSPLSSLL